MPNINLTIKCLIFHSVIQFIFINMGAMIVIFFDKNLNYQVINQSNRLNKKN